MRRLTAGEERSLLISVWGTTVPPQAKQYLAENRNLISNDLKTKITRPKENRLYLGSRRNLFCLALLLFAGYVAQWNPNKTVVLTEKQKKSQDEHFLRFMDGWKKVLGILNDVFKKKCQASIFSNVIQVSAKLIMKIL